MVKTVFFSSGLGGPCVQRKDANKFVMILWLKDKWFYKRIVPLARVMEVSGASWESSYRRMKDRRCEFYLHVVEFSGLEGLEWKGRKRKNTINQMPLDSVRFF